jgi:transcriptional regulator with XRE-family HTH domain
MSEERVFNGYALRAVREAAGRSVRQCAQATGMSAATWQHLESGFVPATVPQIEKVCAHLKVPDQTFAAILPGVEPPTDDQRRAMIASRLTVRIYEECCQAELEDIPIEYAKQLAVEVAAKLVAYR